MDHGWASTIGDGDPARPSPREDFALPSRGEALVALRSALEAQVGPLLVTGEAGVGKTWLWRRLLADLPVSWRRTVVDVSPALDPTALYHLIGHGLGLPAAGDAAEARLALTESLREATADGVRWTLVLDEAHNATAAIFEEVRLLANRLGRPSGFSAMLLAGQTGLSCRLATRPLKPLAARLAAHVHLHGLDIEEARTLLNHLTPTLDWDGQTLERRHRDASGNPRRMLLAARHDAVAAARRVRERPSAESTPPLPPDQPRRTPVAATEATPREVWEAPVIGPVKPPLFVGEGMIEVGWSPDLEHEARPTPTLTTDPAPAPGPVASSTPTRSRDVMLDRPAIADEPEAETIEPINDHYAALQAWNEWERNQGRNVAPGANLDDSPPSTGNSGSVADDEPPRSPNGQPSVWSEGQQGFAPYSQLFSRLRQIRDVNESS